MNAMIIPRNQREVAVHAVFWSGQSILTPGGPSAMSRAKWISSPVAAPGEYRAMPAAQDRGHDNHEHGGKGMRDGALPRVSQPKVKRYVIKIDGYRCDKTCDIKTTRRVDEAGQSEQAQRSGGQVGDFIERAAGQDAERNPLVGCVEGQRDPRQQYRNRPQPDQLSAAQPHPTMLLSPVGQLDCATWRL